MLYICMQLHDDCLISAIHKSDAYKLFYAYVKQVLNISYAFILQLMYSQYK